MNIVSNYCFKFPVPHVRINRLGIHLLLIINHHAIGPSVRLPFPPAGPICLHGNWKELNLRATARKSRWNKEEHPEELRDAMPPIARYQL